MVAASGFLRQQIHFSARVAGQETQTQMVSYGVYEIFKNLRMTASETCCFTWSVLLRSYTLAQIDTWFLYHNLQFRCQFSPSLLILLILLDGWFCINTFRAFKNNVTHIFRMSIFSA